LGVRKAAMISIKRSMSRDGAGPEAAADVLAGADVSAGLAMVMA
jgi:hypothetical protein